MDQTVVDMVVCNQFFPEVKFADKEIALSWDENKLSFCQYFLTKCNVPLDVNRKEWRYKARKRITYMLSQTRNNRNTAMKNSFIGKLRNG